jgi:RNA polymerase sigma factor (sigma-70 family)
MREGKIFMKPRGQLTEWIDACRNRGEAIPLTPELAEKLGEEVLKRLVHRLAGKIIPKFGSPDPRDMAADQFIDLMERLGDSERILPAYVSDSKTLLNWMYRQQYRNLCRSLSRKRPELRGSSILKELGKDAELGMESFADLKPHLDKLDLESQEELDLALDDIQRCEGDRARQIVELTFRQGMNRTEVAKELGVSQGRVSHLLKKIMFCIARRMQEREADLREGFGEQETADWLKELEGGQPPTA